MITLAILAVAFAALFFVAVPVVAFGLMLETCEARGVKPAVDVCDDEPLTVRLPLRIAA